VHKAHSLALEDIMPPFRVKQRLHSCLSYSPVLNDRFKWIASKGKYSHSGAKGGIVSNILWRSMNKKLATFMRGLLNIASIPSQISADKGDTFPIGNIDNGIISNRNSAIAFWGGGGGEELAGEEA